MSVNVKEIIQSMENRVTVSESVGTLIEMQLSKLVRKQAYAKIQTFENDIYEIDSQELIKGELRKFTFLILEFLMETSYQDLATIDDISEFLKDAIHYVKNPWGFEDSFIERMSRDIVREVLMNEGKNFPLKDKPLTNPRSINGTVDVLTQKIKRVGKSKNRTAYKLTDEAFQFLYRKKEVDSYLQTNLTFATMMMYEAITKGNYEGVLQGVKELELLLAHFTFSEVPDFITKMNVQFDYIYEEKCRLADDGYKNLKLAMQEVQKIRQLIGESRQHLAEQEVQGIVSAKSEKYNKNKKKLLELDARINNLLQSFTYALSAIQQLNQEYDRLLDQYEVKTSYEYLDVEQDLYPILLEDSLLNQAQILRALISIFEVSKGMKTYSLDRLTSPKRPRKSRLKADTTVFDVEVDESFLEQEALNRKTQEQLQSKRNELIQDILFFIGRQGECRLSDYLEHLKMVDVHRYLEYLSAEDDDLFYQTIFYDLYKESLYVPRNNSPEEMKWTEKMDESLVDSMLNDSKFKALAGHSFYIELIETSTGDIEMIHRGFPDFRMKMTDYDLVSLKS